MAGSGDDDDEEERSIEQQLEKQLKEQKDSLSFVNDALSSDPSNSDLIGVHRELIQAIKDAEEGLLGLKRSRLLREADAILLRRESDSIFEDPKGEQLDSSQVEPEPLEADDYSVGSKCRFRHTDGRWYNGHIMGFEGTDFARISFMTPTSEGMLICKFFLQQRCRFGNNCRMSHGFSLPISSLKQYVPTIWDQSLLGSSILANPGVRSNIWRKAELASWDDALRIAQVVFQDDGTSVRLGTDALSISEYAQMSGDESDEESDFSSSESLASSDKEDGLEDQASGIGFMEAAALQRGVQTETALFAKWEHHTRGIASKMMASMGYKEGTGLGVSSQGIIDPVSVKVLPQKLSLDHALASNEADGNREARIKKRSRGGKRKRDKKFAEAARAAKAEEEGQRSDVFSFINNQLTGQDVTKKAAVGNRREDRRSLVAYDDEVKELRSRVERLEEMANRNRKDKMMFEAASRKLNETRKALADAEAVHASASNAVVSKEKEKKWLKF